VDKLGQRHLDKQVQQHAHELAVAECASRRQRSRHVGQPLPHLQEQTRLPIPPKRVHLQPDSHRLGQPQHSEVLQTQKETENHPHDQFCRK